MHRESEPCRTRSTRRDDEPSQVGTLGPDVLLRARRGDRDALRQVFATVHPVVLAYCRARLGRHAGSEAEDVAQVVCVNLLAALPRYRDTGRPFLAYVYTCAANAVTDAHRRAARRPTVALAALPEVADPDRGPETHGLHLEVADRAQELLDTLPERMREVLVLRIALGIDTRRTAHLLGLTEGSVRVIQHRALSRLRACAA